MREPKTDEVDEPLIRAKSVLESKITSYVLIKLRLDFRMEYENSKFKFYVDRHEEIRKIINAFKSIGDEDGISVDELEKYLEEEGDKQ